MRMKRPSIVSTKLIMTLPTGHFSNGCKLRSQTLNDNFEDRFSFQFVSKKRVLWMLLALTILIKTFSTPLMDIFKGDILNIDISMS